MSTHGMTTRSQAKKQEFIKFILGMGDSLEEAQRLWKRQVALDNDIKRARSAGQDMSSKCPIPVTLVEIRFCNLFVGILFM